MSESAAESGADAGNGPATGATGEAQQEQGAQSGGATDDGDAEAALAKLMQDEDPEELKKQLAHWKTTAQKHERSARNNSSAAKRLQEIEEANKTELQKAIDRQAAAERERDAATMQYSRMMAAASKDLDPDLIPFLGDGTPEEITERAEQLAGIIESSARKLAEQFSPQNGGRAPAGTRRTRPVESLRPGAAPTRTEPVTEEQMFRQILTGETD